MAEMLFFHFLADPEVQRACRAQCWFEAGSLYAEGHMTNEIAPHNLGGVNFIEVALHDFIMTHYPGIRFDEFYAAWSNFVRITSLITIGGFATVLRPGYLGALHGRGPFANDFTILRMPVGGPRWLNFYTGADRVNFTRIANMTYTGAFGVLSERVSS